MESFKSKCAVGRDKNLTTKKEMQKIIDMQSKEISKISAKVNKIIAKETPSKVVAKETGDLTFSETEWQTLAGKAYTGNQISLPPSPKAGSKYNQNIIGKFAVPCTKTGLDMARAEIDIAEAKLEKAGLLTQ